MVGVKMRTFVITVMTINTWLRLRWQISINFRITGLRTEKLAWKKAYLAENESTHSGGQIIKLHLLLFWIVQMMMFKMSSLMVIQSFGKCPKPKPGTKLGQILIICNLMGLIRVMLFCCYPCWFSHSVWVCSG